MEVFCDASPRRIAINLLGISLQGMFICKVHHRKQNRVQVAFGKTCRLLIGNLLKDVVIWELFPENFFLAEASLEANCQRKEIYNTFLVTLGSVKY